MKKEKELHEYGLDENIPVIYAIVCPYCEDAIISRANHDFRSCTCGKTSIDAGFSGYGYRIMGDLAKLKWAKLPLNLTRRELYDDWNNRKDKHGLWKKHVWLHEVLEIKDLGGCDEESDNGDSEAESNGE